MQIDGGGPRVQGTPDFVEHLRKRLGTTRGEAERLLGDWLANYPREERVPAIRRVRSRG